MSSSPKFRQSTQRYGDLDCTVLAPAETDAIPRFCVILCHGFGAPGTDLVPLGPELAAASLNLAESVLYLFPQAPLDLEPYGFYGGRAWWMIDIERFQRAAGNAAEMARLRRSVPAGMPEASRQLFELVMEVQSQTAIPTSPILLGGFSQGSMVATDVALRLPEPPAGLCIFSGTLIAEDDWRELAAKRGPLPVLMSHGHTDPILPFSGAESLRDLFMEAGFDVEFIPFDGPHTIPLEGLQRLATLIRRIFVSES
jgi:phospholipase/carboxylesterase